MTKTFWDGRLDSLLSWWLFQSRQAPFSHSISPLEFVCAIFGADRVVMGSDYPFANGDLEPTRIIEASTVLTDAEKTSILGTLAHQLFHLEACGCTGH